MDPAVTDPIVDKLIDGAKTFYQNIITAFIDRGVDTGNALEMLLALKRIGARDLEALYGPGKIDAHPPNNRRPIIQTPVIQELETAASTIIEGLDDTNLPANQSICVATTDVHEYGKLVLENVLGKLGMTIIDGGVSTDPDALADLAIASNAQIIALSTYNGIALNFLSDLKKHLDARNSEIIIYIGGKLNQVPDDSNSSLPVDVRSELKSHGAIPCTTIENMIEHICREN
jgi:methylmalonyl-CoA mutase cobalamin-binding subunit